MTISAQQLALSSDLEGVGTGLRNLQIAADLNKVFSGANVQFDAGDLLVVGAPSGANDVVNKEYVDGVAAGLDPKESVRVATTAALPGAPAYDNGAAGVGATLTSSSALNDTGIDGLTDLAIGERILVKDQAAPIQNGIYVVTNPGADGAAASYSFQLVGVISRFGTTDADTPAGGHIFTLTDALATTVTFEYVVDQGGGTQTQKTPGSTVISLSTGITGAAILSATLAAINGSALDMTATDGGSLTVNLVQDTQGAAGNTNFTWQDADLSGNGWLADPAGTSGTESFAGGVDAEDYVLTRSTDFDGSPANEVSGGAFTFVEAGGQAGTGWNVIADGNVTLGTDAVNWSQFSQSASFTGGDGIDITGNTISAVAADLAGTGLEDDGSNNLQIAASAAGDGLTGGSGSALAVLANPGGSLEVLGTGVDIADGGVDTAELADFAVTASKLSFRDEVATFTAAAGFFDGTRTTFTLPTAPVADADLTDGYACLRNGVDDLTLIYPGLSGGAGQWAFSGTTLYIHGDVTGSGDQYRVRYKTANT